MTEITHQPCPLEDCNSRDAFSYNTETGLFKCYSCGRGNKGIGLCYDGKTIEKFTPKGITEEGISLEPYYKDYRGILASVYKNHGGYFTEQDGAETVHYSYPEATKHKNLSLPKKHKDHIKISGSMDKFYGQDEYTGGNIITITEGEEDRLSVIQMLGDYPCVSVPNATPSKDFWANASKYLPNFEKIYLSVDNDSAGDILAEKFFRLFPGKVYRVNHGKHKDANDFLQNGDAANFKKAWWSAQKLKPETINTTAEDFLKVYNETPDYEYFKTGIDGLDEKMLGIHKAAFTLLLAPTGVGKCLHPDQGVMMWDGSVKAAKDVSNGDKLMGDDSTPREVTGTTTGKEEMFKIIPVKGQSWICNKSHMLSVVNTTTNKKFEITVEDYLKQNDTFKSLHKLYRAGVKEFGVVCENTRHNPYLVGAYLGDGHTHRAALSLGPKKSEVMHSVVMALESTGHTVSFEDKGSYTEITFKSGTFWNYIKPYVSGERYIPDEHKFAKDYYRAALLAGLLDTDGSDTGGGVEITQKSERLANDITFVARSLGLAAYVKPKKGTIKSLGFEGGYFRVGISGDFSSIPFRRLKIAPRRQIKDVLRTGFAVEALGVGDYAGFELDGNHRFLLDDFTVTHNTELMRYLEYQCFLAGHSFAFCHGEETQLRSLLGLVSYDLKDNLTRKDLIEVKGREDDVKQSLEEFGKSERFYQFTIRVDQGVDDIVDQIRFLATAMGVEYIFLEPIQDFVSGNTTEKESLITDLANKCKRLAAELNVGIIAIAHANEDGDAKYCKSLTQSAAYEIVLERDPDAEDATERNKMYVRVGRKNRTGGGSGPAGVLTFDGDTYTLIPDYDIVPVVDRSKKVTVKETDDEIPF